jgi:hypothetical protein
MRLLADARANKVGKGAQIFKIVLTICRLYFLSVIYGVGIQKY